jgi:hypothetical protein
MSEPLTNEELRRLERAAVPAPWELCLPDEDEDGATIEPNVLWLGSLDAEALPAARLAVAARNALPRLLDIAERSSPAREPRDLEVDAWSGAYLTVTKDWRFCPWCGSRFYGGRCVCETWKERAQRTAALLDSPAPASPPPAREPEGLRERVEGILMFCNEDGSPVDGFRFREEVLKARRALAGETREPGKPAADPPTAETTYEVLYRQMKTEHAKVSAERDDLLTRLGTPAADPGPGDLIDRCRKAVVVLRDILRHSPMREGVAVADQLLADLAALSPETTRQVLAALVRRANGPCHNMLGFCSTHDQPIGKCLASPSPGEDAATTDRDRLALMAQAAEFWIAMGEGREESRWDVEASRALVMCGKSLLAMLRIPLEEVARRLALTWPPAKFAAPSSSTPSTPAKEK